MKNLKVSLKLAISFAIVLALLVACVVVGIVNLQNVKAEVDTFYNGPYVVRASANIVKASFENMQKSVYRSIASNDPAIMADSVEQINSAVKTIQENVPIIKEHFLGDPEIVTRFQGYLAELAPHREEVLRLSMDNKKTEAITYMETYNIKVIKNAMVELEALITAANAKGEELTQNIEEVQFTSILIMACMLAASVIISIILCVYITRAITKPLIEIEQASQLLSKGNLKDAHIEYRSNDELGKVSHSLRETIRVLNDYIADIGVSMRALAGGDFTVKSSMDFNGDFVELKDNISALIDSLNSTMTQINEASEQVASGSGQVASGSQALSQGTTEQASAVEELAATINEISQQVKNNATNALQANTKANSVGQEAAESNRRMQDMLGAMADISKGSGEISKIIKTIEDIAFQTNILALNAAVEAARAGAAGKGFAVVADEVRNLASKSAEASKNTAALIENSLHAVENGTKIAGETAKSLSTVVDGVKDVADTVDKISLASNQQAMSVMQVTQGIDQISSVVQTNSATAEESAAASEELSGQAQMLKTLVSRFQLKDGENHAASHVSVTLEEYPEPMSYGGSKY